MTWREFKEEVEAMGVMDDDEIDQIDCDMWSVWGKKINGKWVIW
jgi:hypothetical protein